MTNYTPDPNFHESIGIIEPYIKKYKDVENLEIEFRIGFLVEDDKGKQSFD